MNLNTKRSKYPYRDNKSTKVQVDFHTLDKMINTVQEMPEYKNGQQT